LDEEVINILVFIIWLFFISGFFFIGCSLAFLIYPIAIVLWGKPKVVPHIKPRRLVSPYKRTTFYNYAIDATKIQKTLNWRPCHAFEDALEATVDWYMDHMDWVESVRSGEYRKWIQLNYEGREKASSPPASTAGS